MDGLFKLGGTGVVGGYAVRLIWNWLGREHQEQSLYAFEFKAHEATKKELSTERQLRKDAEMELRRTREAHDHDRETWFEERDKDRQARDILKDEVYTLRGEVKMLRRTMAEKGLV